MLSVIVPTMWAYPAFLELLPKILSEPSVGEVVIINNNVKETPNNTIFSHEKIRMFNSEQNLFVAPSWNLGAKICTYDKMAFLSDDLLFDLRVFEKVNLFLDLPKVGMVGIVTPYGETDCYSKNFIDGSIDIVDYNSFGYDGKKISSAVGAGNLFFIRKENWKEIPVVKIFHGEVLQWNRMEEIGKTNYVVINCFAETPWHVTWKKLSLEEPTAALIANYRILDQQYCESVSFRYW